MGRAGSYLLWWSISTRIWRVAAALVVSRCLLDVPGKRANEYNNDNRARERVPVSMRFVAQTHHQSHRSAVTYPGEFVSVTGGFDGACR